MSLQCIFIYNHHKDTSITLKASADITYNNEQHVRISLFDASSWPIDCLMAHCNLKRGAMGPLQNNISQSLINVVNLPCLPE